MQRGDWVSYQFRDKRGTLRVVTGVVMAVTENGLVSVRSDGGQPGYTRGKVFTAWESEIRYNQSPHAPPHENPGQGWFTRCMESVSASGSAVDPGAVCGAQLKRMGRRHNPKVPGLASWNMYTGGTSAAPGKHAYDLYIEPGNLSGGVRQYTIQPVSTQYGRHRGYHLSVAGDPDYSGLHRDLGMFRSPGQAVTAARKHYSKQQNPRRSHRRNPWTIGSIRHANQEAGQHFFDKATMKFFNSKIYPTVYEGPNGIFFVTHEIFEGSDRVRQITYKVRQFDPNNGHVHTHGPYLRSLQEAKSMARDLAGKKNNSRRRKNAGPWSIRKHKKALKKSGSGTNWQPGIRVTRPRGKPRTMTNPRRFTLRAAGREFTVLAKSLKSAWREVHSWLKKEGLGLNKRKNTGSRRRRRNAVYGTSYFVSLAAAVRYYRDYGYDKKSVQRKIAEGEIHIGKPPLKSGDRLSVIDNGTRYQITEGERNRRRRTKNTWEDDRDGHSAAAKLGWERRRLSAGRAKRKTAKRRNRSASMLSPRTRRSTIRTVERRTSSALGKYLKRRGRF